MSSLQGQPDAHPRRNPSSDDNPGDPEVAGDAGILIDPNSTQSIANGIKTALKNKKELSKKGIAQARKFSWEKCAKQTLSVLEKNV